MEFDYKIEQVGSRWQIRVKSGQSNHWWKYDSIRGFYDRPDPDGYQCHASFDSKSAAMRYIRKHLDKHLWIKCGDSLNYEDSTGIRLSMTPELKAFRHYQKNRWRYLEEVECFFGDDEKLFEHYAKVAALFVADPAKLMKLRQISYERSVERAFR